MTWMLASTCGEQDFSAGTSCSIARMSASTRVGVVPVPVRMPFTVRPPASTHTRLSPSIRSCSWIWAAPPSPMATVAMTALVPIVIPTAVRVARRPLRESALHAICKATTASRGEVNRPPRTPGTPQSLQLQPAPLLRVRHAAHPVARLHADDHGVAPVEAAAVLGVVEAGLLGEAHALLHHGVVSEGEVGRLVALDPLAVPGPVVDVLLHSLRDLVLVDLVGHVRAGPAVDGEVDLHVAGVLADLPELSHVRIEVAAAVRDDVGAVVLAAVAADGGAAFDLQRHVFADAVEQRLVGVRIRRERPHPAGDADAGGDAVVDGAVFQV